MPTATSYQDYTLVNYGPLTTTFSAPASCATGTTGIALVFTSNPIPKVIYTSCGPADGTLGNCFPSGSAIDAQYSSQYLKPLPNVIQIFSPGLYCPSGWVTVGAATKTSEGAPPISTGGVFSSATETDTFRRPLSVLDVLDVGETAVLCCPSTATVDPYFWVCYSYLPRSVYQPATAGCQFLVPGADVATIPTTYVDYESQTRTGRMYGITGTEPLSVVWTTFKGPDAAQVVGQTWIPMITLVHKAGDVPSSTTATTAGSTTASSETGSSTAGASPTKNAAASLRGGRGLLGGWPVACLAAAAAAGVAVGLL